MVVAPERRAVASRHVPSLPVRAPRVLKQRREDQPAFALAVAVFGFLGIVFPLIVISFSGIQTNLPAFQMAALVTLYAAFSIARICYYGPAKIVRLAYYIFVYAFMGLPVLAELSANTFPLMSPTTGGYTSAETTRGYLVVFVGVIAFEISTQVAAAVTRRRAAQVRPAVAKPAWEFSQTRVLALGVLGLLMAAIIVAKSGLQPFFDSRQAAHNAIAGLQTNAKTYSSSSKVMSVLLGHASKVPLLIALFSILYLKHHGLWRLRTRLQSAFSHVVILLLVVANVVLNDPIANSRFWMCMVAISIVSVYLPLKRAAAIRWAAIASILLLLFAFTTLEAFRRVGGAESHRTGFRQDLITSGTYSEFQMELAGVRWLEQNNHTDGMQFIGSIGAFVPRAVWPGKPIDTGNLILPYNNPAATLWTEGDIDAGYGGVVIYMVALGIATAITDSRFRRAPPGSFAHAFTPIFAGFVIFLLRGSLQPAVTPAYFLLASILFLRKRVPKQ